MFKMGRPSFLVLLIAVVYALLLIAFGIAYGPGLLLHECAHSKSHAPGTNIAITIALIILLAGLLYLFVILSGRLRYMLIIIPLLHCTAGLTGMSMLMTYPPPSHFSHVMDFIFLLIFFFDLGVFMLYLGSRELSRTRSLPTATTAKIETGWRAKLLSKKVVWSTLVLIHILFLTFSTRIRKYNPRSYDNPSILIVIEAAQQAYRSNSPSQSYAQTLGDLATGNGAGGVGFFNPAIASGKKDGYNIEMGSGTPNGDDPIITWNATAWPIQYNVTGRRSFYIDQTGIVRASDIGGQKGDESLPILGDKIEYVYWWTYLFP